MPRLNRGTGLQVCSQPMRCRVAKTVSEAGFPWFLRNKGVSAENILSGDDLEPPRKTNGVNLARPFRVTGEIPTCADCHTFARIDTRVTS